MIITDRVVRVFIESFTDVDLGIKTRKALYIEIKTIYYLLCNKYVIGGGIESMGEEVSVTHASVLNLLRKGYYRLKNNFKSDEKFKSKYILIHDAFYEKYKEDISNPDIRDLHTKENLTLHKELNNHKKIIRKLQCKISELETIK